jgi:hypothetical protein
MCLRTSADAASNCAPWKGQCMQLAAAGAHHLKYLGQDALLDAHLPGPKLM